MILRIVISLKVPRHMIVRFQRSGRLIIFNATDDSLLVTCLEAVKVRSEASLNRIMRMFLEAAPDEACFQVRNSVLSFHSAIALRRRLCPDLLLRGRRLLIRPLFCTTSPYHSGVGRNRAVWGREGWTFLTVFFPEEDDPSSGVSLTLGDLESCAD